MIHYRPSSGTWKTLTTVTTDSDSHYSYGWKPPEPGTYEVKASWGGDANTLSAESDIKTFRESRRRKPFRTRWLE